MSADAPTSHRDCPQCQEPDGMRLQNAARTAPVAIPLLYICQKCGTMVTIPPPFMPMM